MSRARSVRTSIELDDTIVAIETDAGLTGYGASCPLAPTYLPALAAGTRAGIETMAPALLGRDPRGLAAIGSAMDAALLGHAEAKAALDMACWDLFGKATELPVHTLLGGRQAAAVPLYVTIPHDTPQTMVESVLARRSQGYRLFQIKVGGEVETDIERLRRVMEIIEPGERAFADANRGWLLDDALRVVRALDGYDLLFEQPCATYEECLELRRKTRHPVMLDETINGPNDLLRALADRALDAVVLKLCHVGGIFRALEMMRLCVHAGVRVRIEDTVGRELSNAAVAHLAVCVPEKHLLAAYLCPAYPPELGSGAPRPESGELRCSDAAGLGIELDVGVLGVPLFEASH